MSVKSSFGYRSEKILVLQREKSSRTLGLSNMRDQSKPAKTEKIMEKGKKTVGKLDTIFGKDKTKGVEGIVKKDREVIGKIGKVKVVRAEMTKPVVPRTKTGVRNGHKKADNVPSGKDKPGVYRSGNMVVSLSDNAVIVTIPDPADDSDEIPDKMATSVSQPSGKPRWWHFANNRKKWKGTLLKKLKVCNEVSLEVIQVDSSTFSGHVVLFLIEESGCDHWVCKTPLFSIWRPKSA
jgi:hypothetical protein